MCLLFNGTKQRENWKFMHDFSWSWSLKNLKDMKLRARVCLYAWAPDTGKSREGRHYWECVYQLLSLLYCVLIPTECKQKPLALCFNTGQLFTAVHLSQIKSRRRSVHTPSLLWLCYDTLSAFVRLHTFVTTCFGLLWWSYSSHLHVSTRNT